jgi:Fur family ferric uptake transcriptional regulator
MTGAANDWAEAADQALAEAGYRRGGARRAMLELLDEQACALSAIEIEEILRTRRRAVSRASIYRILEELDRLGVIQRVEIGQTMVRYEPVRAGSGHHHHLVCDHCGALRPFSDAGLELAIKRLCDRVPLIVSDHEVVLHGACADCEP